ncbi:MAG: hypothetical protein ACKVP5_09280 [Aestuariivirga sp.]
MSDDRFLIRSASTDEDIEAAARLFKAYAASLSVDLCFQDFPEELATLPGKYAPPLGDLLLARNENGIALGCVALRPVEPEAPAR